MSLRRLLLRSQRRFSTLAPTPPIPNCPEKPISPLKAQQRLLSSTQPYHISHTEFQHSKHPFVAPVLTKLPFAYRMPKGEALMKHLVAEERNRLITQYPSYIEKFNTGDSVVITRHLSLSDKTKRERIFGVIIAKHGEYPININAAVTIRALKDGEFWEMKIPLHSPFIIRLDVLEAVDKKHTRRKQFELRDAEPTRYQIRKPSHLPARAEESRVVRSLAEEKEYKDKIKLAARQARETAKRKKKKANREKNR